jgi:hypothetical protein
MMASGGNAGGVKINPDRVGAVINTGSSLLSREP